MAKTKQELIEELKNTPDIDPYKHDGSYELVRETVKRYCELEDYSSITFEDFDLFHQMVIMTKNKESYVIRIEKSHIPEKESLKNIVEKVWETTTYTNSLGDSKHKVGMFNSNQRPFKNGLLENRTCAEILVKMFCDIFSTTDKSEAYKIVKEDLTKCVDNKIRGVNYGVLSQILHCIQPSMFPILNGGGREIYRNLGVKIKNKGLNTFIDDCEEINKFLSNNEIVISNFRTIDQKLSNMREDDTRQFVCDEKNTNCNMDYPVNMILYGPPGTGKTYNSVIYAVGIIENKSKEEIEEYIKPNATQKNDATQQNNENQTNDIEYSEILKKFNDYKVKHDVHSDNADNGQIEFVTFHQSYGYEEFIEGIKPRTENGEIRYEIADGVFKKFCKKAENNPDKNYVFIIDEINRGNISKIFGELITLIEDTKRIGAAEEMRATLPYSGESFGVPDNVYILGTMNTADRSISLMDTALRRRFRFVEMMPDPELIVANIGVKGKAIEVKEVLETMNKRIEYLYDREHTIGHSFFMKLNESELMDDLKNVMLNSVLPLLQEYFYDDYNKIRLVLGDNQKTDASGETCFVVKKNDNKNDLFGATDEINDTEVFEINEAAFDKPESYKYLLSGTGSPKHDQTGAETSSENN